MWSFGHPDTKVHLVFFTTGSPPLPPYDPSATNPFINSSIQQASYSGIHPKSHSATHIPSIQHFFRQGSINPYPFNTPSIQPASI